MQLGCPEPAKHGAVVAVHGNKRPSVKNQRAHAAGLSDARPSSRSARAISSAVNTPCSASQPDRNSASASARSLLAAASASHEETGLPAWAAADLTASPRSGSNETLSLSTFIAASYPSIPYHGSKRARDSLLCQDAIGIAVVVLVVTGPGSD